MEGGRCQETRTTSWHRQSDMLQPLFIGPCTIKKLLDVYNINFIVVHTVYVLFFVFFYSFLVSYPAHFVSACLQFHQLPCNTLTMLSPTGEELFHPLYSFYITVDLSLCTCQHSNILSKTFLRKKIEFLHSLIFQHQEIQG